MFIFFQSILNNIIRLQTLLAVITWEYKTVVKKTQNVLVCLSH
jgi:hypothetical protein